MHRYLAPSRHTEQMLKISTVTFLLKTQAKRIIPNSKKCINIFGEIKFIQLSKLPEHRMRSPYKWAGEGG